jgi:hypothetical protein
MTYREIHKIKINSHFILRNEFQTKIMPKLLIPHKRTRQDLIYRNSCYNRDGVCLLRGKSLIFRLIQLNFHL